MKNVRREQIPNRDPSRVRHAPSGHLLGWEICARIVRQEHLVPLQGYRCVLIAPKACFLNTKGQVRVAHAEIKRTLMNLAPSLAKAVHCGQSATRNVRRLLLNANALKGHTNPEAQQERSVFRALMELSALGIVTPL